MASSSAFDTHSADERVKTLVNTQLKSILKRERLAVSGLKAAMQNRVITQLHQYAADRDLDRLNRLKGMINNPEALQSLAPLAPLHQAPYNNVSLNVGRQPAPPPIMATGSSVPGRMKVLELAKQHSDYSIARLMFKESPFYTILQNLTPVQECKALVREATRDHVDSKIIFRSEIAEKFTLDPDLRVMIFCASEPVSQFSKLDVTFPYQVEIKVNMDEVKANLRGLKNKPGSTRPADITTLLRKRANYDNTMSLTYALTHKKFYFVANLVKRHPVEELVNKLKAGKIISQEQVIKETEEASLTKPDRDGSSDDEDLVEIRDPPRLTAVKNESINGASFMRTPPTSSREQSSSSVPPPSVGAKRSASTVIDLISDDEDEENQRPSKRPSIPHYPVTPTYSSNHIRPQLERGNSALFRSYPVNRSSESNPSQRAYPYPP
ncbi:MAG: hypothetical protein LQ350_003799 [Teloschistes chrysophthalmus]|nr:MAG: hypothetical protein LQ350_003799 [Niorma chrysophthalma]